jgi:predicted PurR-regulated permease PerM
MASGASTTSATSRNALVIVTVILVGIAARWMVDIVTPLLLAMFLAVMVDSFSRVIRRRLPQVPPLLATVAAVLFSLALFAGCVIVLANNAGGFLVTLVKGEPKLNRLIMQAHHTFHLKGPRSLAQILARFQPTQYIGSIAIALQGIASNAILVLVYLGFLLASRRSFERKAVRLFVTRDERHDALQVFLRIRDGVERYLWIQTITGVIIAAGSWMVMALVGLDNAVFWAFLIFVVNYIPIVGAVAAIVLPAIFAWVQFDGFARALVVLAGLGSITFVVGNILLPRMQGDSLNMDPLVVLLSLAFWGALWGITGMFLSTPLTVLVMVILAQFEDSRWIAILLSANGDPLGLGRGSRRSPDESETSISARAADVAPVRP